MHTVEMGSQLEKCQIPLLLLWGCERLKSATSPACWLDFFFAFPRWGGPVCTHHCARSTLVYLDGCCTLSYFSSRAEGQLRRRVSPGRGSVFRRRGEKCFPEMRSSLLWALLYLYCMGWCFLYWLQVLDKKFNQLNSEISMVYVARIRGLASFKLSE